MNAVESRSNEASVPLDSTAFIEATLWVYFMWLYEKPIKSRLLNEGEIECKFCYPAVGKVL